MSLVKDKDQIERIRYSGRVLGKLMEELGGRVGLGVNLLEIDRFAEEYIVRNGGRPSFKGFRGYPNATCISVNEDVIHGIPRDYNLKEGDIVGVDIGMEYEGGYGDMAYTFSVGEVSEDVKSLLLVCEEALYRGIRKARVGNRVGDIGYEIQGYVEGEGYTLVEEYCGHGVGLGVWEEPAVPNIGEEGEGEELEEGMVIAIEPMVNMGSRKIYVREDNWTVTTEDGYFSAHFEHTVLVQEYGGLILTKA